MFRDEDASTGKVSANRDGGLDQVEPEVVHSPHRPLQLHAKLPGDSK
jgi:hypothetical protein